MNQLAYLFFTVIIIWLCLLSYITYKSFSHYQRLVAGTNKRNLLEILDQILYRLTKNKKELSQQKEMEKLIDESVNYVQKVGILRFNPFSDTGGDQSFILVVLDGSDNGIVLSSLHSRGKTRWYAKNVAGGKGVDYKLSKEELEAIKKAVPLRTKRRKAS